MPPKRPTPPEPEPPPKNQGEAVVWVPRADQLVVAAVRSTLRYEFAGYGLSESTIRVDSGPRHRRLVIDHQSSGRHVVLCADPVLDHDDKPLTLGEILAYVRDKLDSISKEADIVVGAYAGTAERDRVYVRKQLTESPLHSAAAAKESVALRKEVAEGQPPLPMTAIDALTREGELPAELIAKLYMAPSCDTERPVEQFNAMHELVRKLGAGSASEVKEFFWPPLTPHNGKLDKKWHAAVHALRKGVADFAEKYSFLAVWVQPEAPLQLRAWAVTLKPPSLTDYNVEVERQVRVWCKEQFGDLPETMKFVFYLAHVPADTHTYSTDCITAYPKGRDIVFDDESTVGAVTAKIEALLEYDYPRTCIFVDASRLVSQGVVDIDLRYAEE
jgi:hypothetical protein